MERAANCRFQDNQRTRPWTGRSLWSRPGNKSHGINHSLPSRDRRERLFSRWPLAPIPFTLLPRTTSSLRQAD